MTKPIDYTKFTSIKKDIAKKYNVSRTTITAINNGQNFYQNDIDYPIRKQDQHSKPIKMIEITTGKTFKEFSSAAEAAKYLNLPKKVFLHSKNVDICFSLDKYSISCP